MHAAVSRPSFTVKTHDEREQAAPPAKPCDKPGKSLWTTVLQPEKRWTLEPQLSRKHQVIRKKQRASGPPMLLLADEMLRDEVIRE